MSGIARGAFLQINSDCFRLAPWTFLASGCKITTMISIHHGGDLMNSLRDIVPCRVLASTAVLFGAMVTILLVPAYGQQEVDPTWYDPWAAPNTMVVHSSQPPAVVPQHQPTVSSVTLTRAAAGIGGSDTQPVQTHQGAPPKRGGTAVCNLSAMDPDQDGKQCTSKPETGS